MKLCEIVVHMDNYNFTKFHQNQMKNKKVLLIACFSVQNFKVSVELWKSYIVPLRETPVILEFWQILTIFKNFFYTNSSYQNSEFKNWKNTESMKYFLKYKHQKFVNSKVEFQKSNIPMVKKFWSSVVHTILLLHDQPLLFSCHSQIADSIMHTQSFFLFFFFRESRWIIWIFLGTKIFPWLMHIIPILHVLFIR